MRGAVVGLVIDILVIVLPELMIGWIFLLLGDILGTGIAKFHGSKPIEFCIASEVVAMSKGIHLPPLDVVAIV